MLFADNTYAVITYLVMRSCPSMALRQYSPFKQSSGQVFPCTCQS